MIIPVILSGGSGTRLWPLSTPARPKQFLPLVTERTLFQETLLRLHGLPDLADPVIVCNEHHRHLVADQLTEIGVAPQAIVLEPEGRNTAPAIGVAALLGQETASTEEPTLLVLPADHVIDDAAAFREAVARAARAARAGRLVTFGIVPTHPETGYGYIEQGVAEADWLRVERFVEKPDLETAKRYLETKRFLWNSGMFVFGAATILDELGRANPAIREACESSLDDARVENGFMRLGRAFLDSPSDSIDYAVMEKTDRAAVVPLEAGWNDVGSWTALYDVLTPDKDGNVIRGDAVTLDAGNNLIVSGSRRIALLGLEEMVIIEGPDALLIMPKARSQDIKRLLATFMKTSDQ